MLGDHAKSPFEVVPDALNGCAHRVGVIPRFLPFLPSSTTPSSLPLSSSTPLSSSFLIFPPFIHPQLLSSSSSFFVPSAPSSFVSLLPLLFLTSHFPSLSTLIPLSSSTRLPTSLYLPLRLFSLSLYLSRSSSPSSSCSHILSCQRDSLSNFLITPAEQRWPNQPGVLE